MPILCIRPYRALHRNRDALGSGDSFAGKLGEAADPSA